MVFLKENNFLTPWQPCSDITIVLVDFTEELARAIKVCIFWAHLPQALCKGEGAQGLSNLLLSLGSQETGRLI